MQAENKINHMVEYVAKVFGYEMRLWFSLNNERRDEDIYDDSELNDPLVERAECFDECYNRHVYYYNRGHPYSGHLHSSTSGVMQYIILKPAEPIPALIINDFDQLCVFNAQTLEYDIVPLPFPVGFQISAKNLKQIKTGNYKVQTEVSNEYMTESFVILLNSSGEIIKAGKQTSE